MLQKSLITYRKKHVLFTPTPTLLSSLTPSARHLKNGLIHTATLGVTQTGTLGVTHTGTLGVTHTVFEVTSVRFRGFFLKDRMGERER
ncbi:MAG: hypothetical protein IJR02_10285 [Bacteroidaceae bacterium]|nr:hypothetical protein [Bacteroidaceae bacterium]